MYITKNLTGYIPTASVYDLKTSNQYVMGTAGSHTSLVFLNFVQGPREMVQAPLAWNPQRSRIDHPPKVFWTTIGPLPNEHAGINNGNKTLPGMKKMYQTLEKTTLVPRFCNSAMIRGELEPAKFKSWSLIQLLKHGWLSVLQCSTHP